MKLMLHIHSSELPYVTSLKQYMSVFNWIYIHTDQIIMSSQYDMVAKLNKCTHIATTSISAMKIVDKGLEGTASDNEGYLCATHGGTPIILLPSLKSIHTMNYGGFLLSRYIKKLSRPETFIAKPEFNWTLVDAANWEDAVSFLESSRLCAVDIETVKLECFMTSVAYSAINRKGEVRTYVAQLDHATPADILTNLWYVRCLNATSVPKIFQNGEYDNTYFIRWDCPVQNWYFDTYHFAHCQHPELPKDLAFLSSFYLRNFRFWKTEMDSNRLEYNAKDAHNTLFLFIAQIAEAPDYAITNYKIEFPMVFPCMHSGLEGLAVDLEERERLKLVEVEKRDTSLQRLRTIIHRNFNPNSPQQVLILLQAMGYKTATSSDEKTLIKFAERGPLEDFITKLILDTRGAVKAIGTYYEFDLFGERCLYKLDPAGTDTGRLASKKSSLWCGTNLQNQPAYCKSMYVADTGWLLGEIDNSQAESRTTAYLSQDITLMDVVENSPDFHCTNASLFFGIPFEELYDVATKKKLNVPIRDLAKRTNHGANYNMQEFMLVETMGTANIFKAARLLGLPASWSAVQVARYLLTCFDKTYPRVRGAFQKELIHEVRTTGKLVLPNGWTRQTFLKPWKDKQDLNAVVAHKPQGLNAQLLNQAYKKIWRTLQLDMNSQVLRLKAQIHDSILFQYRIGEDWVPQRISELMKIPCTVHGRTFVIPNDLDVGKERWKTLKK